jgi:hypothetical protein
VHPCESVHTGAQGSSRHWTVDEADLFKLQAKRTVEMLPAKQIVSLGLSKKAVPTEFHDKFRVARSGAAAGYLLADVVLLEPLRISVDGSERTKLHGCRCGVALLNKDARSLNHALTLLSQAFEIDRMSHTGNVFQQGFIHQDDRWLCLDDVRLVRVTKALQGLSESIAQQGVGGNGTTK